MSVTDLWFLFLFLPVSLVLYFMVKKELQIYILLAVSLLFYACGSPRYFVLLLASLIANAEVGFLISQFREKKAVSLGLFLTGVFFNITVLAYYKYFDFLGENAAALLHKTFTPSNLALPLGISFFTFKAISYLADVYQQKIEAKSNPVYAALYLSFFGQVQSGPLSRYSDMGDILERGGVKLNFQKFSEGVYRFVIGFNKKILLANVLSNITQETFGQAPGNLSMKFAWFGAVCYSMQLFFDFSGYSDMAIGISKMFGLGCPENFRYPYMTASVSEFWRRWHITLGAWFRDYVYIPLGGSRVKKGRLCLNLLAVWLLTGIWHGANWNFVVWGLSYFAVIAFEKLSGMPGRLKKRPAKVLYRIAALLFINFEWVLFRAGGLREGLAYIKVMLMGMSNSLADKRLLFLMKDNVVFLLAALILCFPVVPYLEKYLENGKLPKAVCDIFFAAVNVLLFIWSVSFVVAGQNNPFAYANF